MIDQDKNKSVPPSHRFFYPLAILLFAGIYFCLGKLAVSFEPVNRGAAAVWPPSGLSLGVLLIWGSRFWPGILIGSLLINLTSQGAWGTSLLIAVGNVLEGLLAAMLVRRFANGLQMLERVQSILKFILLATILSTLTSAIIGVTGLCVGGFLRWSDFFPVALTWWLGDMTSDILIVPFLLVWLTRSLPVWNLNRVLEAVAFLLLLLAVSKLVFLGGLNLLAGVQFKVLIIPPLFWAALRFGQRGAITSAFFVVGLALWATLHGLGPFASFKPVEAMLLLQIFIAIVMMSIMVLLAILSEREQALKLAVENQNRWQFALEGAGDGVWDWDLPTGKVIFSKRWKEMLGHAEAEIGNDFSEWQKRVHPDDLPAALVVIDKYVRGELDDLSCEFRMRCKDGGWKWILTRGMATERAAGQPVRIIGTHADISERKRMEIKLRESEERYRGVVEDQTEIISRLDVGGTMLFVNEVYARFFGKTSEELVGTKWHPAVLPEDLPRVKNELGRLSSASPVVTIENRVFDGAGDVRWMQFVNRGFFDPAGRLMEIQSVGRDITAKKKSYEALRISEERFRLMYESMVQGVVVQDTNGKIISMNPAAELILGPSPAEFLGRNSEQEEHHTIHEDGSPFPGDEHPAMVVLKTGRKVQNVVMGIFNPREEKRHWIQINAVPVFQPESDQPYQIYTLFDDITESKNLSEMIRFSEERYRGLAEFTPDAIFILDRQLIIQYVNRAATQWLGRSVAEILGHPQANFFPPDMADEQAQSIREVFETGKLLRKERFRSFQGNVKWIETRLMPLRNDAGTVVSVMGISRDLTEQRQAEELFKESAAWSRKVLATTMEGFFRLDIQGRFLDVNEAYCRMTGYSHEELLAMSISDVSLIASVKNQIERILNLGSDRFESSHRCKDGSIIQFEVVASHITLKEVCVFSFLRDITEQKQLERQLSEISAVERQRIGYDLHDGLGQQLAGIAFKTKALEEDLAAAQSPQTAEAAEIVGLLNDAISQTRSLARMLAPVEVEANGLLAAMENLAAEFKSVFKVECIFLSSPSRDELHLDAKTSMTLYRIAQEAIHNAINRGAASRVEIHLDWSDNAQVSLTIRDDGKGFATEPKPKTGMGLRIMKFRASSIGGGISIHSKIGCGTEVKCLLPLKS